MSRKMLASIMAASLLVGCNAGEEPSVPEPHEPPPSEHQEERAEMTPTEPVTLRDVIEQARADLAERLEIAPDQVDVRQAREVVWRDGSRGCPSEDMMYTQALVQGYLVVLEADGEEFAFHAGSDGKPFHCPAKRRQQPLENDREGR